MMVRNILSIRVLLLVKQFRGFSRRENIINIGFLLLLLGGAGYGLAWLGKRFAEPGGEGMLAALLPTLLMSLLFFTLIQLADTLHQLFLAPDLQWLLRAPLTHSAIFLAKLIECTFSLWLPALIMTALFLTLGVAQSAPLLYFPLILAAILSLVLGVTALGMLLVFLLGALFPPKKLRELLPIGFAFASIGGILGQQWMLERLATWSIALKVMLTALLDTTQMLWLTMILVVCAVLVCGLTYVAFRGFYFPLFSRLQVVDSPMRLGRRNGKPNGSANAHARSSVGFFAAFPASARFMLEKEWFALTREPRQMSNLIVIPLMTMVIMLPMLRMEGPLRPLLFWLIMVYSGMFGINSAEGQALSSFAMEGRRFVFYRVAPVNLSAVMWSKYWISWLPAAVPWVLVLALGGWLLGFPLWQTGTLIAFMLLLLAGTAAVCIPISAQEADLSAESTNPKMSGPAAWIALGLGLIWMLLLLVIVIGVLFQWAGESELIVAAYSIARAVPLISPLFPANGLVYLVVGFSGVLIFGFVLRRMWLAAIHRLENWEMA
jgi:hypothetical protein